MLFNPAGLPLAHFFYYFARARDSCDGTNHGERPGASGRRDTGKSRIPRTHAARCQQRRLSPWDSV